MEKVPSVETTSGPSASGSTKPGQRHHGWRAKLELLATVLTILTAGSVLAVLIRGQVTFGDARPTRNPAPDVPIPKEPQSLDGAAVVGELTARVVVIEYSDLLCPYCAKFAKETLPEFRREFVETGKVRFAFRHLPLETIHPMALSAAAAAVCAGKQGKFWEMHDALYEDRTRLDASALRQHASTLLADMTLFEACVADKSVEAAIRAEAAAAKSLGLTGTPAFLVGLRRADGRVDIRKVLRGAQSKEALARAVHDVAGSA